VTVRIALLLLLVASTAHARTLHGLVYADANRDGKPQAGEHGVAGAVVAYDVARYAVTDARGEFTLELPPAPSASDIAWVRVPDGYEPGPVWAKVGGADRVDLGLRPWSHAGPVTFVVAADTHIYKEQQYFGAAELGAAVDDAVAIAPAFFTILGDITQGQQDREFDLIDAALANLGAPYVPVPGNHDWYDNGATWFRRYGPDNYSFDIGTIHFVVWNMALKGEDLRVYLAAELARVDKAMTIVALTHAPPPPQQLEILRELGVRYLFTGHTHHNRTYVHGDMLELNTEPLLMGGLDFTPGGYRVVTIDGGKLTTYTRTITDGPYVSVVGCVGGALVVAAELDAGDAQVTAAIDCGEPRPMQRAGGWDWTLPTALAPGNHTVAIEARSSTGQRATRHATVAACEPGPRIGGDWPQLGGGADHQGHAAHEIAPPVAPRWVQTIGGLALQTAPVIADGIVYITAADLATGTSGGVVALELATGKQVWRRATPMQVRGAATVVHGSVVVAQVDGTLRAFDARTGDDRWTAELGTGLPPQAAAIFASVAADSGDVLVGNQNLFGAFAGDVGTPLWTTNPVHEGSDSQSFGAIAIADGIAVGVFNRAVGGVGAWDRATGAMLWRVNDHRTIAINSSPVIADGAVYVVDGSDNAWSVDLVTGAPRWAVRLDNAGFEWGNATVATPAIARGILVVPTLYRDVVALEAASGRELWRFAGVPSPLHATHYRGAREAGFEATPVITGDIVWVADTAGELSALELRTGTQLWHTSLQAPVLAGLAVSGDWLVAASYDGTVQALSPGELPRHAAPTCLAPQGCCDAGGGGPLSPLLGACVLWRLRRRRRA